MGDGGGVAVVVGRAEVVVTSNEEETVAEVTLVPALGAVVGEAIKDG